MSHYIWSLLLGRWRSTLQVEPFDKADDVGYLLLNGCLHHFNPWTIAAEIELFDENAPKLMDLD